MMMSGLLLESRGRMRFLKTALAALSTLAAVSVFQTSALAANNLPAPEGLADGPGIWVNMWNYPTGDIESYCQNLHAKGIRNLFVQTSRSNTEAITHPGELSTLIEACHRYKIRVIAWSFAELANPISDADKLIDAARFTSIHGQHLDAVAANMEKDLTPAKVEVYSQHLRSELGLRYPLIAVVYSPLNHAPQVARIDWKLLDRYYSVLAPMNYWNSKYQKLDPYSYTLATIQKVRELVGRPGVEIHVIGDGMGTHSDSIAQFMRACQQAGATSASIYPNYHATEEQLDCIAHYADYFPVNSRFRLAAFREVVANGSLDRPGNVDPASSISRGQFYKLVVRQLGVANQLNLDPRSIGEDHAFELLSNMGALKMARIALPPNTSMSQALTAPIGAKEAFNLVAAVLNIKAQPGWSANIAKAPSHTRPDRWLVQPAFAEPEADGTKKPLTYLDAAQIVVSAAPVAPRS